MADNQNKTLNVEEVAEINTIVVDRTVVPTAATTISMTDLSTSQQIFTGSTAGLIMRLPNATTLRNGLIYTFWNTSNQNVTVRLNDNTTVLVTNAASEGITIVLQDNTTTNGTWITTKLLMNRTAAKPMHFGESGAVGNLYLFECTTSKLPSDQISPVLPRKCAIVGYSFIALTYVGTKTIKVREASNLGVDKMSFTVTTGQAYGWNSAGYATFNAGERFAVYLENTVGGNISTPRVVLYYVWID